MDGQVKEGEKPLERLVLEYGATVVATGGMVSGVCVFFSLHDTHS